MKKALFILLASFGVLSQASASLITATTTAPDNSFTFAGYVWDTSFTTGGGFANTGSVEHGVTADTITITGSDGALSGTASAETKISTSAAAAGTITFDWAFSTLDAPGYDVFFWINDGGTGDVTCSLSLNSTGTGTACASAASPTSFMVGLGDLFGFSIFSIDNAFGAASVDISNLTFCTACDANGRPPVSAVPLPPAFLLFGVALAGLGFVQKRKQLAGV